MEPKRRDVFDIRTLACMKAPQLLPQASHQSPEKIAIKIIGGLIRDMCGPLCHVHRAVGVQDPLCDPRGPTKGPLVTCWDV